MARACLGLLVLSRLAAPGAAVLVAGSCRHASPNPAFVKAPWSQLAGSVPVEDLSLPDLSSFANTDGNALRITGTPGATLHSGFMGSPEVPGWARANSTPAKLVTVLGAKHASQALKFAAQNNLKITVKSTGHDWFGRSAGGGSMLLWTHKMTDMLWHDDFTPAGCGKSIGEAVTLGAGVQFWQYYTEAAKRNRLVVGGTCSTVGHVGFTLGGGYGDYSHMYGSGATNLVEAEVVLADGTVVSASACNGYSDLFRALRGGGGAFGLVTKATYRTYPFPAGKIGDAYSSINGAQAGTKKFLAWYADIVRQGKAKHFGGQAAVGGWAKDTINFQLKYTGITAQECTKLCAPLGIKCNDGGKVWPPKGVQMNPAGMLGYQQYWEKTEPNSYHTGSLLRYVNADQLESPATASAIASAARHGTVWLALNYVLGQSSDTALAFAKETSVHPQVYEAVLAVKVEIVDHKLAPNGGTQIDQEALAQFRAMRSAIDAALPGSGSYYNEGDYSEEAWAERYWGSNYADLLRTKAKYDPTNAFTCHQCVGSEGALSATACGRRLSATDGTAEPAGPVLV